jgi:hypothetical protein
MSAAIPRCFSRRGQGEPARISETGMANGRWCGPAISRAGHPAKKAASTPEPARKPDRGTRTGIEVQSAVSDGCPVDRLPAGRHGAGFRTAVGEMTVSDREPRVSAT